MTLKVASNLILARENDEDVNGMPSTTMKEKYIRNVCGDRVLGQFKQV